MRLPEPPTEADLAACRAILARGSRSFSAAARLLPARVRAPATALYAFCRVADDAIDGSVAPDAAHAALLDRLDAIYAGTPMPLPPDRALAAVVARHAIPCELPAALLEGFAWDAAGRTYATLDQLHDYAARVAATVGVMMALLMGVRDAPRLARAGDLGTAMQLTNIARDVGEDARAGRLYLPLDWLAEAGIDPREFLLRPAFTPAVGGVVRRLLAEAERLYHRAEPGIAALPADCRRAIGAASRIYAEIGRRVGRNGYDSVTTRAVVGGMRKLALIGGLVRPRAVVEPASAPVLPANAFLVQAVLATPAPLALSGPPRGVDARAAWLVALFTRLQRERV
jgi:phytoene synthase